MKIQLTICGFHLQFADFAYICGIHKSSIELYKCLINFLRVPQIVLDCADTIANSVTLPIFKQFCALQCIEYLFVESKTAKKIKEKKHSCGFRDKSDFDLLWNPLTIHRMHSLAS